MKTVGDFLKTARSVHWTIVFSSFVILVFALSPKKVIEYDAAFAELKGLGFYAFPLKRDFFLKHIPSEIDTKMVVYREILEEVLGKAGIGIPEPLNSVQLLKPSVFLAPRIDAAPLEAPATLKEVDRFIKLSHTGHIFVPREKDFRDQLVKHLKIPESASTRAVDCPTTVPIKHRSRYSVLGIHDASLDVEWPLAGQRSTINEAVLRISFIFSENTQDRDQGNSCFLHQVTLQLGGEAVPLNTFHVNFQEWLRTDTAVENYRKFLAFTGLQEMDLEPFPYTKLFWHLVKNESALDAASIIRSEREKSSSKGKTESVVLFGLKIPSGMLIYVAPAILLVLEFYLLLHIRALRSLIREFRTEIEPFPWISLYTDPLSRLATYTSLCIIPVVTCGFFIRSVVTGWKPAMFAVTCVILTGVIALVICRDLRDLSNTQRASTGNMHS